MKFNEELKRIKLEKNLTQQGISDLIGVPKRTIENWEADVSKPPEYVQKLIIEKIEGAKTMKEKIYAEKTKNGKVIEKIEIGTAVFTDDCISARKYNEIKRKALKLIKTCNGESFHLVTESGKADTFGGYPALNYQIKFI